MRPRSVAALWPAKSTPLAGEAKVLRARHAGWEAGRFPTLPPQVGGS